MSISEECEEIIYDYLSQHYEDAVRVSSGGRIVPVPYLLCLWSERTIKNLLVENRPFFKTKDEAVVEAREIPYSLIHSVVYEWINQVHPDANL